MQCVNFIRTIFSSMTQYTLCICQLLWYTYNLLFDTYMYIHVIKSLSGDWFYSMAKCFAKWSKSSGFNYIAKTFATKEVQ